MLRMVDLSNYLYAGWHVIASLYILYHFGCKGKKEGVKIGSWAWEMGVVAPVHCLTGQPGFTFQRSALSDLYTYTVHISRHFSKLK